MKKNKLSALVGICLALVLTAMSLMAACAAPTPSPSPELSPKPTMITVASYEVGTGTYIQLATVGEAVLRDFGIRVRGIPLGTATARNLVVMTGEANCGIASVDFLFAREGMHDFSSLEFGPQPLHLVYQCLGNYAYSLATRADSGIKTYADLKGRKLPYVVGSPSPNLMVEGALAWAGLTYDDVELIEISSFQAMYEALLSGLIDACPLNAMSPIAYQMEETPGGIFWIPMPPEDKESWSRYREYYPVLSPVLGTFGAGLSEEHPVPLCNFNYPAFFSYEDLDDNTAYWITKAFHETYDSYKDISPVMPGWNLERALDVVVYPWHKGSIRYLKEIGLWTDRLERNQELLVEREQELRKLWEDVVAQAVEEGIKGGDFPDFWLNKRAELFPKYQEPVD